MKRLCSFLVALTLAAPALAQTLPIPLLRGPLDPSQTLATLNSLITSIDAVLVPALGPSSAGGVTLVNQVSMTGGASGSPGVIGLQTGADANAGIQINPNGSGNIILFGQGDTGVLQFASSASFVPATGFAACPGVVPGKAPLGVQGVVTSYLIVKDWLGRSKGWATC